MKRANGASRNRKNLYIGGTPQTAVQAQHAASMSQVSFIQEVGFKQVGADTELRYVDFEYKKWAPNATTEALEQTLVSIKGRS